MQDAKMVVLHLKSLLQLKFVLIGTLKDVNQVEVMANTDF